MIESLQVRRYVMLQQTAAIYVMEGKRRAKQ
jgi:hypothetical protein